MPITPKVIKASSTSETSAITKRGPGEEARPTEIFCPWKAVE